MMVERPVLRNEGKRGRFALAVSAGHEGAGRAAGALCPGRGCPTPRVKSAQALTRLLELPDPVLSDYLFGHATAPEPPLAGLVAAIRGWTPAGAERGSRRCQHGSRRRQHGRISVSYLNF